MTDSPPHGFPAELSDRFEPLEQLGVGGFGVVYRARDRELGRQVAVKLGHDSLSPANRQRFEREAASLAGLGHPGLVTVYDHGVLDRGPYLVMELLEGTSLDRLPADANPLPPLLQIAEALAHVHAASIVHRDVKPANMMLPTEGPARLVDFGLIRAPEQTRLTEDGALVGTLPYLAPEVLRGGATSPASDWYAWGVSLYQLREQRFPFDQVALFATATDGEPLPPPEFTRLDPDGAEAAMVRALLADDPAARPASPAALRAYLEGGATRRSDPASPAEAGSGARRRVSPATLTSPVRARASSASSSRPMVRTGRRRLGIAAAFAAFLLIAALVPWGPEPAGDRAPAPGPPAAAPAMSGPARARLERVIEDMAAGHRPPDGHILPAGRGGPLHEHIEEVLAEHQDVRVTTRWRRFARAVREWAEEVEALSGGELSEDDRELLLRKLLPLVQHLYFDRHVLFVHRTFPSTFMPRGRAPAAFDDDGLSRRLVELRAVSAEEHGDPGRYRDTPALLAAMVPFGGLGPPAQRVVLAELTADALEVTTGPWVLHHLSMAALSSLPAVDMSSQEYPCEIRERVIGAVTRRLRDQEEALPPSARCAQRAFLMYRRIHLFQACRQDLDEKDRRLLAADLAAVERDLEAAPGAVVLASSDARQLYSFGFLTMRYGEDFERQMAKVKELRTRAMEATAGTVRDADRTGADAGD